MALILHIETATAVCSVALAENGKLLSIKEDSEGYRHAECITLFVEDVLKRAGRKLSGLDAVAVSSGPGSYTGLRIGISAAKGLCYALEKPLIGIQTLKSLTAAFHQSNTSKHDSLFCPMIDARRMEVYCAVYDDRLKEVEKISAKIIDEESFKTILQERTMYFFGDGAAKCKPYLATNTNAVFVDNIFSTAASMVSLAEAKYNRKDFEDVALFEPLYLKTLASPN